MNAAHEAAVSRKVTLLVPGLAGGQEWPVAWPRALARLLARAEREDTLREGWAQRALGLFGLPPASGVAALARLGEGGARDERWWVRCDPVHLAVDGDRLLLLDNEMLEIAADEAVRLKGIVASVFAEEGGIVEVYAPTRWYLTLPAPEPLVVSVLTDVIGHNVHDYLPTGNSRYWRTRLNEAQMLLHQALVGSHGGEGAEHCVNSVWFWGGGVVPPVTSRRFTRVYTDDVFWKGVARATQAVDKALPSGPHALDCEGGVLVVLRGARGPVSHGDTQAQSTCLMELMQDWLMPLTKDLARGHIQELTIMGDRGPSYHLTRRDLWRFWRAWRA
ncbi:MAG: hypothetical protein ACYDEV_11770 [Acidiferrobacter sp.]